MRVRQTCPEPGERPLPCLWLLSDERNDGGLEAALERLPAGSGFVFRHYHLPSPARFARWCELRRLALARGHLAVLAASPATARAWRADGVYGEPTALQRAHGLLTLATAHDLAEIGEANRARVDAVLLSPVFATRSHPGARPLGPVRFRLLAAQARMPVIALGGMNAQSARRMGWPRWAAIDGLVAH